MPMGCMLLVCLVLSVHCVLLVCYLCTAGVLPAAFSLRATGLLLCAVYCLCAACCLYALYCPCAACMFVLPVCLCFLCTACVLYAACALCMWLISSTDLGTLQCWHDLTTPRHATVYFANILLLLQPQRNCCKHMCTYLWGSTSELHCRLVMEGAANVLPLCCRCAAPRSHAYSDLVHPEAVASC